MGSPFRTGYPRARVHLATGYNPVDGAQPVIWDSLTWEHSPDPMWDPGTPTLLTVPRDGLWGVWATVLFGAGAATSARLANLRADAVTIARFRVPTTGEAVSQSFSSIGLLTAGSVIDLVTQCDGSNLLANCSMALMRLGPVRWTG